MKKDIFKQKKFAMTSLILLIFIGFLSSVVFSSAIVSQTASFFNYSLSKEELFDDSNKNLIFSVNGNMNYYNNNKDYIWRDKTPTLYRSNNIFVNGIQTNGFESYPLHFFNQDTIQKRYLGQYVVLKDGSSELFEDGFSSIISTSLYKTLFGDDIDYASKTLSISCGQKVVSSRISALFELDPKSSSANNKLYSAVYGEDYCFVNSNVADELKFENFSVLLNSKSYFNYFSHYLFREVDYDDIEILGYYSTFSKFLDSLVKYNNRTRVTRIIVSTILMSASLFCISLLLNFSYETLEIIRKHLFFWMLLSLTFVVANLVAPLFTLLNKSFIVFTMGLGINFVIYIVFGLSISLIYRYLGKEKNGGGN